MIGMEINNNDISNNEQKQTDIKNKILITYSKLFIQEESNDNLALEPENDVGYVEYKRTLIDCNQYKAEKYATQMKWRITQNTKNHVAIYYIGVDDDGSIVGLDEADTLLSIGKFVEIANSIGASISGVKLIYVKDKLIVRLGVKIKKSCSDYFVVDFD